MTQAELNKAIATTISGMAAKMMQKYAADVTRLGEKDARKRWREEYGLVFVRGYTVTPRFRHYKVFAFTELPKKSQRVLEAQANKSVH